MKFTEFKLKPRIFTDSPVVSRGFVLCVLCMLFVGFSTFGQNVISESDLKNSSSSFTRGGDNLERLRSLVYDANDAAYFRDGSTNYYGSNIAVLYVDLDQLSTIARNAPKLGKVELVKIYTQGNSLGKIDQAALKGLPALKYIYLVCDTCGPAEITKVFSANRDSGQNELTIVYSKELQN